MKPQTISHHQDCLLIEGISPENARFARSLYRVFCSCDLDLHPMTITYEHDLDMLKTYQHTKNEISRSGRGFLKLERDRQTDRRAGTTTDAFAVVKDRIHVAS